MAISCTEAVARRDQSRCAALTDTRLRPAARRRLSTAAPAFDFMRARKPCVFARWRRLGWNVRLGIITRSCFLKKICALAANLSISQGGNRIQRSSGIHYAQWSAEFQRILKESHSWNARRELRVPTGVTAAKAEVQTARANSRISLPLGRSNSKQQIAIH
jgi:hypothetical protein